MNMRMFFIFLLLMLIPALSIAAPKQKKTKKTQAGERGLKAVSKTQGGRRVALVIGNGAYIHTDTMPRLSNPPNDADDIAASLRRFGFEVIARKNLTKEQMESVIADFGRKSANSDAALFYYAGHGLQVKGKNYLVPVDAKIESEPQVPYRSVDVNQLLDELENSRSRVNIVMLDACRNNPISGNIRSGNTRGLAAPASIPNGTIIVYATGPGNVAADGNGRNGLFTSGILSAFNGSDLSLFGVLTRASEEVERVSNQQQVPYINGPPTLQKNFSFAQIAPPEQTEAQPATLQPPVIPSARKDASSSSSAESPETLLWIEVQSRNTVGEYTDYLYQFPKGKYSALAKKRIKQMKLEADTRAREEAAKAAAKARKEAEEKSARAKQEAEETAARAKQEAKETAARVKMEEQEARTQLAAAQAGDLEGMQKISQYYENGTGIVKDPARALFWSQRANYIAQLNAANAGDTFAMRRVADLYESGIGVAMNRDQAEAWRSSATTKEQQMEKAATEEAARLNAERIEREQQATREAAEKAAKYKAKRIEEFEYFEDLNFFAKHFKEGDLSAITFSPFAIPISIFGDLLSLPSRTTAMQKLKNQAVLRPSTWGNPDSMIARASKTADAEFID